MTPDPLDLDAIEARARNTDIDSIEARSTRRDLISFILESTDDVKALIARVRELEAERDGLFDKLALAHATINTFRLPGTTWD